MGAGSFNLCNLPPWVIASRHYEDNPQPIEIQGVREANGFLFQTLDALEDPAERVRRFDDYLSVKFQLHHWQDQSTDTARRSIRNSYLRYLHGWGVDSSSIEGAVLKGWVESRMGLPPTYHGEPITGPECPGFTRYAIDRMKGSARTNAIQSQLDLVYAFTQYELARRFPGERWFTLYRGQHDAKQALVERLGPREWIARLNNLCSFTGDPERAWEFGTTVWEVRVPLTRIFFMSAMFPRTILRGEGEYLVIGGEVRVRSLAA